MRTISMRAISVAIAAISFVAAAPAMAQQSPAVEPGQADATIKAAFPTAPADWQSRLTSDETMKQCSAHRNNPPKTMGEEIQKREAASIQYPPDNQLLGDWKKGEAVAQSGYGLRFSDYPPRQANGGNCYACHQLTQQEVSYGTVGPSLLGYGKLREFKPEAAKAAYEKIYNAQVALPCSNMPRFGTNKILTVDQIKDAVALLMSPESPVNK
jgi:sulfur-oxidizing protein SoxX